MQYRLALLFLLVQLLLLAAAPRTAAADYPSCGKADASQPCRIRPVWSKQEVKERLGGEPAAWWAQGDVFTVLLRRASDKVELCCAIYAPMDRVSGSNLWTLSLRVPSLERAILDVAFLTGEEPLKLKEWRGPDAPPGPPLAKEPAGEIADHQIDSAALGEPRKLTVYTPPGSKQSADLPVIYLADGSSVQVYGRILDALIARGEVPPLVLVGLWSGPAKGRAEPGDLRSFEYLEGFKNGDERYKKHERFLIDEVLPWAETRFNASKKRNGRFLSGSSNGAVWAYEMARGHPELFGGAIVMSAGWRPAVAADALKSSRLFMGAGTLEGEFLTDTWTRAEAARLAGADVKFNQMISGHSSFMWQVLFVDGIRWLFDNPRS